MTDFQQELDKAREFAKEWNTRNSAGNLSMGWLHEQGDNVHQLVNLFQELDRRMTNVMGDVGLVQAIMTRIVDKGGYNPE